LLNSLLRIKPTMMPFNGSAPAASALIGGQIDYMTNGIDQIGQHIQDGTIVNVASQKIIDAAYCK